MKALSPQLLSLLLIAATFNLLPPSSAATITTESRAPAPAPGAGDFIGSVCNHTVYADLCYSTFSPYAKVIKQSPLTLARIGLAVSHTVVRRVAADISALAGKAKGSAAGSISVCISTFGDATDQINDSLGELRQLAARKGGDFKSVMDSVLTEMSAALTNEETCTDEFEDEPEGPVKKKVKDLVTEAENFSGMALMLVNYCAENGSPQ